MTQILNAKSKEFAYEIRELSKNEKAEWYDTFLKCGRSSTVQTVHISEHNGEFYAFDIELHREKTVYKGPIVLSDVLIKEGSNIGVVDSTSVEVEASTSSNIACYNSFDPQIANVSNIGYSTDNNVPMENNIKVYTGEPDGYFETSAIGYWSPKTVDELKDCIFDSVSYGRNIQASDFPSFSDCDVEGLINTSKAFFKSHREKYGLDGTELHQNNCGGAAFNEQNLEGMINAPDVGGVTTNVTVDFPLTDLDVSLLNSDTEDWSFDSVIDDLIANFSE